TGVGRFIRPPGVDGKPGIGTDLASVLHAVPPSMDRPDGVRGLCQQPGTGFTQSGGPPDSIRLPLRTQGYTGFERRPFPAPARPATVRADRETGGTEYRSVSGRAGIAGLCR